MATLSSINNIHVAGIGNMKEKNPFDNEQFLSLEEYRKIAVKLLTVHGAKYAGRHFLSAMLKNEDLISDLANNVMQADWDWDGRGTREGFRKNRAIFFIRRYVDRKKKSKVSATVSLDARVGGNPDNASIGELIDTGIGNHESIVDDIEYARSLLNSGVISEKQVEYIRMVYLDGKSMTETAEHFGVTRQCISNMIGRAFESLREFAQD